MSKSGNSSSAVANTGGVSLLLLLLLLCNAQYEMSTPKHTRRTTKRKQPVHNTPPSGVAGKKTKGTLEEDDKCEVCIVCDCTILEASESTEGQDAVFCEGDCQGWIHRMCAGFSRPAFNN